MGNNKTHFRKVFKSNHLGIADLEEMIEEGIRLVFTISHVKQEYGVRVAGKEGNYNIGYFKENIKPLVINATNSNIMKKFCGNSSFVEDWTDVSVELYIDPNVKRSGETVGGVRISPNPPKIEKPTLTPENEVKWNHAVKAYKRDGNLNAVLSKCNISTKNQDLIIEQANV